MKTVLRRTSWSWNLTTQRLKTLKQATRQKIRPPQPRKKRKFPSMEDAEYIETILGHKHNIKRRRRLKAKWDNGYIGWHLFNFRLDL